VKLFILLALLSVGYAQLRPVAYQLKTGVVSFIPPENFLPLKGRSETFVTNWEAFGAYFTVVEVAVNGQCNAQTFVAKEVARLTQNAQDVQKTEGGDSNRAELILTRKLKPNLEILSRHRFRAVCNHGYVVQFQSEVSLNPGLKPTPEELEKRLEATWDSVKVE
jgi:hypothetical protein